MSHDPRRFLPRQLAPWRPLLVLLLAGCTAEPAGREVVLSGDIPGLDSLAARGDSLIARTERGDVLDEPVLDTQRTRQAAQAAAAALVERPVPSTPERAPTSPAGAAPSAAAPSAAPATARTQAAQMMARAQARADSMARSGPVGRAVAPARGDTGRGTLVPAPAGSGGTMALRAEGRLIQLSGVGTTGLTPLNGTEVMVRGVRVTPRDLVVTEFFVRGWNGLPAVDGTILADGSLRASDGSGIIRGIVPPLLRGRIGARVWIAIRGGQPVQFDLIER
jgi:hypothetical protein